MLDRESRNNLSDLILSDAWNDPKLNRQPVLLTYRYSIGTCGEASATQARQPPQLPPRQPLVPPRPTTTVAAAKARAKPMFALRTQVPTARQQR